MALTEAELEELELLLVLEEDWAKYNAASKIYPDIGPLSRQHYPKHMECFAAGKDYIQRCFMGGNGTGKTFGLGAYEMMLHLTGDYPTWWVGHRFDRPITAWACGDTRDTVRRTVQKYLLGDFASKGWSELGTGTIPRDAIVGRPKTVPNTNNACDFAAIRHVSGGISTLYFKSYDQKRTSFQGDNVDFLWLDEEPPSDIFQECAQRGRDGGVLLLTFTPLSGHSEVVDTFLGWEKANKAGGSVITITCAWDDVPHLDERWKAATMATCPPWLRDARRRGIPSAGIGKVYTVEEDEFVINPIPIPPHWRRAFGFDHGYFNTAAIWGAYDKDNDVLYIYSDYKRGEVTIDTHAIAIKARGDWIPGVGDASARESDGQQIIDKYKGKGVNLRLADKSVDAGIQEILSRLSTGKLKIFSTCQKTIDEYRRYRYNEKQQIVKEHDHLMDALRYLVVSGLKIATTLKLQPTSRTETVSFG